MIPMTNPQATNPLIELQYIVVSCVTKELKRLPDNLSQSIYQQLAEVHYRHNVHLLFSNRSLAVLTEQIFESSELRDFFLDTTAKLNLALALSGLNSKLPVPLERLIAESFCVEVAQADTDLCLTPHQVMAAISCNRSVAEKYLTHNKWLMTFVLIAYFFDAIMFQMSAIYSLEPTPTKTPS